MLHSMTLKAMARGFICTVALATALPAQDTAPAPAQQSGSYTVKEGDTLWDIAKAILGDPFLWPEIYRLNTDVVEDPHWIYPGEVLRLAPEVAAPAPVVAVEGAPAAEPGMAVAQPVSRRTVFSDDLAQAARITDPQLIAGQRHRGPAVRAGEYYAAPWVDKVGGPNELGRISFLGDVSRVPRERTAEFTPIQLGDLVTLELAQQPAPGTRFMAFSVGDLLRDQDLNELGQLVRPVGVVRVEKAVAGQPALARIVQQYSRMMLDQGLLLMPLAPPDSARPVEIAGGASFTTLYKVNEPAIVTLTNYVIISATDKDRLRPGDRVSFYRPRRELESGQVIAEAEIARGQVMKVTSHATTVLILGQQYTDFMIGTPVRVIAKMP